MQWRMRTRRSTMNRSRSHSCRLRKGCIKLFFFALTFIAFVTLQYLLQFVGPAWRIIQRETEGIPVWILLLAFLGMIPSLWVIVLGIDQLLKRVCQHPSDSYESSSSDEDTDDIETGSQYQLVNSREPKRKKCKKSSPNKSTSRDRSGPPRDGETDSDEDSKQNPTDVDVSVHPVDTTIAAGGEPRVSPYYNVSLMNFSSDAPSNCPSGATNQLLPTAPMMVGGPAVFKRDF